MKLKLIPLLLLPALMLVGCGPTDIKDITCDDIADEYVELTKEDAPWIHKLSKIKYTDGYTDELYNFYSKRTTLPTPSPVYLYPNQPSQSPTEQLICTGKGKLNTGESMDMRFGAFMGSDGVLWVGGRVAPFLKSVRQWDDSIQVQWVHRYEYTDGKGNYREGPRGSPYTK